MVTQHSYRPVVLCVDDDKAVLYLMRIALELKGFRVLAARDGRAALEAFTVYPVDAVVLDYEMPGMNGCDVAREMTRLKPSVPKLLFSGGLDLSDEESRFFQGFCSKPCGVFTLAARLNNMTDCAMSA